MLLFSEHPISNEICDTYDISVNKKAEKAVKTRVSAMPFNRLWPGNQRPLEQTEEASYVYISTDEEVLDFTVSTSVDFREVVIRPLSAGVTPSVSDGVIRFSIDKCGYYTVELDGPANALHIFVDPIHDFRLPDNKDSLYYFGPGVHNVGELRLKSDATVYIHRDAVVLGSILAVNAENIRILGEGVLDGSFYERKTEAFLLAYDYTRAPEVSWERRQMADIVDAKADCFTDISSYEKGRGTFIYRDDDQFDKLLEIMKPVKTGLSFYACENIEITGIILRNCAGLSMTQAGCRDIHYKNIKLIGNWRYNSDGIDFYNCSNCSVKQCFLRSFDDTVCVKGQIGWDTMDASDIVVEECVLWNDWGHTIDIGVDTVAPEIKNIVFSNCDLIHNTTAAIDIGNCDRAFVHNVLFEDLRIEFSGYDLKPVIQSSDDVGFVPQKHTPTLIDMFLGCGTWSVDNLYGRISDVVFRNISVISDYDFKPIIRVNGYNEDHDIKNIIVEKMTFNGKTLNKADDFIMKTNEFADFKVL